MADWSRVLRCLRCRKANPVDAATCLACGYQLSSQVAGDADDVRPYNFPDASVPFVARRTPSEVETAVAIVQSEALYSWDSVPQMQPSNLTDYMVAVAERGVRLKLPAALLAILKMQNGGEPKNRLYSPDHLGLPELCGIARGCTSLFSLQEMPERLWEIFERFLSDATYRQWRDSLRGEVHSDWGAARPYQRQFSFSATNSIGE